MLKIKDLKIGDEVKIYCLFDNVSNYVTNIIWDNDIDYATQVFAHKLSSTIVLKDFILKIIGLSEHKCVLHLSPEKFFGVCGWKFYEDSASTYQLDKWDPKAIGNRAIYCLDKAIYPIENSRSSYDPGGCKCSRCKEFFPYAVPNQADGTLKCYSCRFNPYR